MNRTNVILNRATGFTVGLVLFYATQDISLAVLAGILTVIEETLIDMYMAR